jgi:LmbE family N-acetylglucosaminyl deacetylase
VVTVKPFPESTRNDALTGTLLIVAPHMDDEVLACGGLIASRPDPGKVHVVYATDGTRSPVPVVPWRDVVDSGLGEMRRRESIAAMALLGVPERNLHFLGLPEDQLPRYLDALDRGLRVHVSSLRPQDIFVPFRFDRHPDHLAVNRTVTAMKCTGATQATLFEYFVYHRWRLLPRRNIRAYLRPDQVLRLDITGAAARKRAALDCFKTQTTRYYEWQTRPVLQPALLDQECGSPEQFLRFDPDLPGDTVFTGSATWIRVAHVIEPKLLRLKYLLKAWGLRLAGQRA